jgi:3-hydroxyisobutyrate dehydrogenase
MINKPQSMSTPSDTTLVKIESKCWQMLLEGVGDRNNAMHQAVVSNVKGNTSIMRTVILRRVDSQTKKLYFHTDYRSLKVADIKETGILSWLFYDQSQRTQIRLSGATIIHHKDEFCKTQWARTPHHSRRSYMFHTSPSTPLTSDDYGMSDKLITFNYTLEESEIGFKHFAVVETSVDWLEWYFTHHTGNKRAEFNFHNAQIKDANWLMP